MNYADLKAEVQEIIQSNETESKRECLIEDCLGKFELDSCILVWLIKDFTLYKVYNNANDFGHQNEMPFVEFGKLLKGSIEFDSSFDVEQSFIHANELFYALDVDNVALLLSRV